jgi:hypothetical protein
LRRTGLLENGTHELRLIAMAIDGDLNWSGQLRIPMSLNAGMAALDISARRPDAYSVPFARRTNEYVGAVDAVFLYQVLHHRFRGKPGALSTGAGGAGCERL